MKNILLVGAGQLGSRYLQGLSTVKLDLFITVVDPSDLSLNKAKKRWFEAEGDESQHTIRWCKVLPQDLVLIDLAIISTSARGRADLVKKISSTVSVRYWVLEKVLAQSKKELDIINAATIDSKGTWVNMVRRVINWHQQLKFNFYEKGPLKVRKTGGLWGLACNTIHFIDLISWWTGESLLSVDTSRLDRNWLKSKRLGYFEVIGELLIKFSGGTELILQSNPIATEDLLYVEVSNKDIWTIDELNCVAFKSKKEVFKGEFKLQSEITGPIVKKILTNGTCELTTLKKSSDQHKIFLEAMLAHWNFSNKLNDKVVPIT
ncbi:hypothetical protein OAQ64_04050 [Candidatus Pelagibacter sp.]|nr:hypothetical protein [Candidatus Pelagibacter sp.]